MRFISKYTRGVRWCAATFGFAVSLFLINYSCVKLYLKALTVLTAPWRLKVVAFASTFYMQLDSKLCTL